jgi:hypothetical protein
MRKKAAERLGAATLSNGVGVSGPGPARRVPHLHQLGQIIDSVRLRDSRQIGLQLLFIKFFEKSSSRRPIQADNFIHHFTFAHTRLLSPDSLQTKSGQRQLGTVSDLPASNADNL